MAFLEVLLLEEECHAFVEHRCFKTIIEASYNDIKSTCNSVSSLGLTAMNGESRTNKVVVDDEKTA